MESCREFKPRGQQNVLPLWCVFSRIACLESCTQSLLVHIVSRRSAQSWPKVSLEVPCLSTFFSLSNSLEFLLCFVLWLFLDGANKILWCTSSHVQTASSAPMEILLVRVSECAQGTLATSGHLLPLILSMHPTAVFDKTPMSAEKSAHQTRHALTHNYSQKHITIFQKQNKSSHKSKRNTVKKKKHKHFNFRKTFLRDKWVKKHTECRRDPKGPWHLACTTSKSILHNSVHHERLPDLICHVYILVAKSRNGSRRDNVR